MSTVSLTEISPCSSCILSYAIYCTCIWESSWFVIGETCGVCNVTTLIKVKRFHATFKKMHCFLSLLVLKWSQVQTGMWLLLKPQVMPCYELTLPFSPSQHQAFIMLSATCKPSALHKEQSWCGHWETCAVPHSYWFPYLAELLTDILSGYACASLRFDFWLLQVGPFSHL